MTFIHNTGDMYKACGTDVNGRRFCVKTNNPYHILGINLYKGNVYQKKNNENNWVRIKSV